MALIPPGTYKAQVVPVEGQDGKAVMAQFTRTKKGNPQVALRFELLEGDCAGRHLTWFGSFTGGALEWTIKGLRNCGFRGDELATLPSAELNETVFLVIEHETDDKNKTHVRIRWINSGKGSLKLADPMSADDVRHFSAEMKSKVASIRGDTSAGSSTASAPPAPPQQSYGKDDIPF